MSLFCLVHGSTQNASGWKALVPELENRGHDVVCVSLPGEEPMASGSRYARVIADSLGSRHKEAVVVAHSVSGLFLPLVPAECPVSRLVFLAALIPQIGKSFMEQFQCAPEMFCPDWIGKDPTKDDAAAMHYLFHDCSPAVAHWALTTRSPMYAKGAASEVCPLDRWPDVPSSYILCREDRTLNPNWWRQAARDRLGVVPIELPGGHCPHVSRPQDLADVLAGLTAAGWHGRVTKSQSG